MDDLLLKTKVPTEQLAEVRRKIAAGEAEIQRLDAEIGRRVLPVLAGDRDATRVAAELEQQKGTIIANLPLLRAAEAQLAQAIADGDAAKRRAAAEALPAELAADRAALLRLDDEIEALFEAAGAKCRERFELGATLARRSGSVQLKRHADTLPARIKASAARHFVIDAGQTAAMAANNLLGIVGDFHGPRAHWTMRDHDEPALDDLVPCFAAKAEALAAKNRLAQRGTETVLDEIGASWTLTRIDSLFASHAAADQFVATSAAKLVVLPRGPGWVVMPAPLAESAAALAGAAEAA